MSSALHPPAPAQMLARVRTLVDPGFALAEELRALDAQLAEELGRPARDEKQHRLFLVKLGLQLRRLADQAHEADCERLADLRRAR